MSKKAYSSRARRAPVTAAADQENDSAGAQTLASAVGGTKGFAEQYIEEATEYTRNNPTKALLSAAAAGYVIRAIPVGAILSSSARLAVALIKPAVLFYFSSKAYSLLQSELKRRS